MSPRGSSGLGRGCVQSNNPLVARTNNQPDDANSDSAEAPCPFCEIARGADRSVAIVCEATRWLAFLPPEPATPGHTLVVPRAHFPDFWALEEDLAAELANAVVSVGRAIDVALNPEGMNLISSSGQAAEQTVFHVHLHVVPRWSQDGFGRIWPPENPSSQPLAADLAARIRTNCRA